MFKLVALICSILTAFHAFANQEDSYEEIPLSTPDQIASLRSDTDFLIAGLISPLSGQPVIRQTDLIVRGAQELVLNRVYIPPHIPCSFPKEKHQKGDWEIYNLYNHLLENYKGWQFYPHSMLLLNYVSKEFRISDPNGITLDFRVSNGTTTLSALPYAISNTIGDVPSGRHDPRNTRIVYQGDRITVQAADGTIRFYIKKAKWTRKQSYIYLLEKEILPHGKVLKYHYQGNGFFAEAKDLKEQLTYASIQKTGVPRQNNCRFTSNTGINVDCSYLIKSAKGKIGQKKKKDEKKMGF